MFAASRGNTSQSSFEVQEIKNSLSLIGKNMTAVMDGMNYRLLKLIDQLDDMEETSEIERLKDRVQNYLAAASELSALTEEELLTDDCFFDLLNSSDDTENRSKMAPEIHFDLDDEHLACIVCKQNHKIRDCDEFRSYSKEKIKNTLRKKNCCFRCFEIGHQVKDCTSGIKCEICNCEHNTLLHRPKKKDNSPKLGEEEDGYCISVIKFTVNRQSANAIMSTGAAMTMVSKSFAKRAKLEKIATKKFIISDISGTRIERIDLVEIPLPFGLGVIIGGVREPFFKNTEFNRPSETFHLTEDGRKMKIVTPSIRGKLDILLGSSYLCLEQSCRQLNDGRRLLEYPLGWAVHRTKNDVSFSSGKPREAICPFFTAKEIPDSDYDL